MHSSIDDNSKNKCIYLAIRHSTSHLSKLTLNDYKLNSPKNTAITVKKLLNPIINLPQNTVHTRDIREVCLSPAKTRQHHVHPLQSKQVVHLLNAITKILAFHFLQKKFALNNTLRETKNTLKLTAFTTWASNYPFIIVGFDNSRCFL
jgi:hypothetical protein